MADHRTGRWESLLLGDEGTPTAFAGAVPADHRSWCGDATGQTARLQGLLQPLLRLRGHSLGTRNAAPGRSLVLLELRPHPRLCTSKAKDVVRLQAQAAQPVSSRVG